jgi:hypothetical protein
VSRFKAINFGDLILKTHGEEGILKQKKKEENLETLG